MSASLPAQQARRRNIERLRWSLQISLGRIGFPGAIGVVLLLLCVWVTLVDIARVERDLAEAIGVDSARGELTEQSLRPTPVNLDSATAQALPLPAASKVGPLPARVMATLRGAGIVVNEIAVADDQRLHQEVRSIDLSVSARGQYGNVKRALDDLLSEQPSLALTYLSLGGADDRSNRGATVDARIRLRYFYSLPK